MTQVKRIRARPPVAPLHSFNAAMGYVGLGHRDLSRLITLLSRGEKTLTRDGIFSISRYGGGNYRPKQETKELLLNALNYQLEQNILRDPKSHRKPFTIKEVFGV